MAAASTVTVEPHALVAFGVAMPNEPLEEYWSSLIVQVRNELKLSQEAFASKLETTQATVSRWEAGESIPLRRNQQLIEDMAAAANLASINGLLKIVTASRFPMILTDRAANVLAASVSSGFAAGRSVIEQTPEEERENFAKFAEAVIASGFWEDDGKRFDYEFKIGSERRRAVVQSIMIRGHVYAVVQRLDG
jgi:transcriptional regulator with XRE-family HTH domain